MAEQGSEFTYNTFIKVASYAGDVNSALAVLDDMAAAGFAPTAAVWGSLLVACGKVCISLPTRKGASDMSALHHCHSCCLRLDGTAYYLCDVPCMKRIASRLCFSTSAAYSAKSQHSWPAVGQDSPKADTCNCINTQKANLQPDG